MHELGVVFKIKDHLKKVAEENQLTSISAVTIGLGEVSTVIPDYLTNCWEWARKKEPLIQECEMKIERIPAISYCEDCGEQYSTIEHAKICPKCGSEHTYLLQGNEFMIREIEVLEPEEA